MELKIRNSGRVKNFFTGIVVRLRMNGAVPTLIYILL